MYIFEQSQISPANNDLFLHIQRAIWSVEYLKIDHVGPLGPRFGLWPRQSSTTDGRTDGQTLAANSMSLYEAGDNKW